MAGAASSSGKVCVVCGIDCADKPRTKDAKGRYYCKPCYDGAAAKKKAPGASPPSSASAPLFGEPDTASVLDELIKVEAPPVQMSFPCPSCGAGLQQGAVLCTNCGRHLNTGEAVGTMRIKTRRPTEHSSLNPTLAPVYLLFMPHLFFRHFAAGLSGTVMFLIVWLTGMSGVMDQLDIQVSIAEIRGTKTPAAAGSWGLAWGTAAVSGLIGGGIGYVLWGLWYRVRLWFCGASSPDYTLARRVCALSGVPLFMLTVPVWVIASLMYATPAKALESTLLGVESVLSFVMIGWSIWLSFSGARNAFETKLVPAVIWFIVVPLVFYATCIAVVIAVLAGVMLSGGGPGGANVMSSPNTRSILTFKSNAFSFSYPGNWSLLTTDPNYDPDSYVILESPTGSARVELQAYESPLNLETSFRGQVAVMEEFIENARKVSEFTRWGRSTGLGAEYTGSNNGQPVSATLFVSRTGSMNMVLLELCLSSDLSEQEPGLAIIRDSIVVTQFLPPANMK